MSSHKAPKSRDLEEYYHFCKDHVAEYNKAWDYFQGMSQSDIEDHIRRTATWDRPTWRYTKHGDDIEEKLRAKMDQEFGAGTSGDGRQKDRTREHHYTPPESRDTPEMEAMAIMGLEPPVTLDDIKARYKTLAKKYHPDLNRGQKEEEKQAEDLLKKINMAYTVLKMAYQKYEKLEK